MRRPNSRDPRPDVASGLRGPRRDADGRHAVGARAPTGPDTYFGLILSQLELARRSAEAGYPLAQLNLANLCLTEDIPERKPGEVQGLLTAAADAGIP